VGNAVIGDGDGHRGSGSAAARDYFRNFENVGAIGRNVTKRL
jgi:hypothetical protein